MKKLFFFLFALAGILSLTGCGMKECECQAFDFLYHNNILDPRSDSIFTVLNYTKSDCEQFNEDEIVVMDSVTYIHHGVMCKEN